MIDKSMKILVVDDMEGMRKFVGARLFDLGLNDIEYAENGQIAWDLISSPGKKYDLVLSDVTMPEMNGIELLKMVKANDDLKSMKFIMITAEIDISIMAEVIKLGVDEYLIKPFDKLGLQEKLNKVFTSDIKEILSYNSFVEHMNQFLLQSISAQCCIPVSIESVVESEESIIIKKKEGTFDFFAFADCIGSDLDIGVLLHFDEDSYLKYIGSMFGTSIDEMESSYQDIVAEFLNIALGKVRAYLNNDLKLDYKVTIPVVVSGEGLELANSGKRAVVIVKMSSFLGNFDVIYQEGGNSIIPWQQIKASS